MEAKPAHSERRSKGWSFPKLNLMFPEWGGQTQIGFCNNVRGLFPIADSGLSQEASLQGASLAAGSEDQLNNQPHNSSVMQRPWGLFPPSGRAPCLCAGAGLTGPPPLMLSWGRHPALGCLWGLRKRGVRGTLSSLYGWWSPPSAVFNISPGSLRLGKDEI